MTKQETITRIQSREYSSGSVAYHLLQPEVTRVTLSDGSIVARLGSALIGDPIAPAGTLESFAEHLSANMPDVSLFHVEQNTAKALSQRGYHLQVMGIESRISLPFSLCGRDKSDLRRALNRAHKTGVKAIELTEQEYTVFSAEIARLNQHWLATRKHFNREFRFLARPFVERYQPGERRFVALKDGRPIGIAVYDPVYRNGACIGYFEALMRCDSSFAGARDLLTVTAMEVFASTEPTVQWLSLGLSPFAPVERASRLQTNLSLTQWTLKTFYRHGNRIFNCRGLAFHKARYRGYPVPIYFATKSRFPLLAIYRACRQSNIDPLQPLRAKLLNAKAQIILTLKHIYRRIQLLRRKSFELVHSNHK